MIHVLAAYGFDLGVTHEDELQLLSRLQSLEAYDE